jgi:2-methylcitrate dehydratase PrpD
MTQTASKTVTHRDASFDLARHAVTLTYDTLPPAVTRLTKQCVLDTLGVIIGAGQLAPEARAVAGFVKEMEGKPESTLLSFGGRAPAPWAAFANGSLGHMIDYDDRCGGGHPSVTTVPVAFAIAEKLGGVSGRELLAAIAAGVDIQTRLSLAIPDVEWTMTEGWFATQLLGFQSGAATAGRLLGLTEEQMLNALGIAFTQASGSREMAVGAATHARALQAGFTGQGGIVAALLAARGITGPRNSLEGRYGLYQVYLHTKPDRDALIGELGARFSTLDDHCFKAWPACAATRSPVGALLGLREAHGIRPEDVEEIVLVGGDMHTQLLSEPLESKRRPQTSIDAKYSIPFTIAAGMVNGNVTLGAYTPDGRIDPDVLAMAGRVRHQPVPEERKTSLIPTVEVRTKDGRVFSRAEEFPLGDNENPMTQEQIEAKFRDCVSFSALPVPPANVDRVIDLVNRLETLADATEVIRLLSPN